MSIQETIVAIRSIAGTPKEAMLLTIDYKEEGGQWLAECIEFGTATHANTIDEVRREIHDGAQHFLCNMEELGWMDQWIRQNNLAVIPLKSTAVSADRAVTWDLPIPVVS